VTQAFSLGTNSSTAFADTDMSGMVSGMIVIVDASLQPDGPLMATKVQSMMNSGGVMGDLSLSDGDMKLRIQLNPGSHLSPIAQAKLR
jgi:hypothetical protein